MYSIKPPVEPISPVSELADASHPWENMTWTVSPFQPVPGFWWVSSMTFMPAYMASGVQANAIAAEWSVMPK